jgi:hypothetical protein
MSTARSGGPDAASMSTLSMRRSSPVMSAGLKKWLSAHSSADSVPGTSTRDRNTLFIGMLVRSPQVSVVRLSSSPSAGNPPSASPSRLRTRRSLKITLQSGSAPRSATARRQASSLRARS